MESHGILTNPLQVKDSLYDRSKSLQDHSYSNLPQASKQTFSLLFCMTLLCWHTFLNLDDCTVTLLETIWEAAMCCQKYAADTQGTSLALVGKQLSLTKILHNPNTDNLIQGLDIQMMQKEGSRVDYSIRTFMPIVPRFSVRKYLWVKQCAPTRTQPVDAGGGGGV